MRTRHLLVAGSAALLVLTGCSSSTSSPSESPVTPPASASPTETSSPTNVLPPIIVDGKEKAINAKVGDVLDITVPNVVKVSTDNAQVLKVTQPRDDGSAQFNAGAEVLAPGKATLTIETADTGVEVTVNATG